jgi:hypothetical protein
MMRSNAGVLSVVTLAFVGGFLTHVLYHRWNPPAPEAQPAAGSIQDQPVPAGDSPSFLVTYMPAASTTPESEPAELPPIVARDVEKIRQLTGQQARVRGRVFRVGHSPKSNTYFINFGPSREALTAVIFNSAAELFEKNKQPPKQFENREVEIVGFVKDHPQFGLEIVLEHPKQIKILN